MLTAGAGFAQPVSFKNSKNFTVGANPVFVVTGDFDEDNEVDLAVVNNASEKVALLLGDGDPATLGFTKPPPLNVGNSPQAAGVGDFNNDGHLDLAIANFSGDNVSIRLGNGDGTFTSVFPNLSPRNGPISIAVGHFNGDSNLDLAVANHKSDNVSIFMGNGNGTFDPAVNFDVGNKPIAIAVGNFNSSDDSHLDLAVTNFGGKTVSLLLGDGSGGFSATPKCDGNLVANCTVGGQPVAIVTGDFDGDGLPDLATANQIGKNVSILLGTGTDSIPTAGLFDDAKKFSLGNRVPVSLTAADFNGDGALDLAAAHFPGNRLSVLLGNGDGTFGHRRSFSTPKGQFAIAADDFNGDGQPDLAVANGKLSIRINNTEFPGAAPSITVTAPDGGESWPIGSDQDITWTSTDITTQNNDNVRIYISRDGGATWKILDRITPNDGLQTWKVKGPAEPNARIKVCSVNFPAICDTSGADFGIIP
ncbi:MAG: FG-GAP repeat domain-containing protein [Candidatus Binatia bacterium]